MACCFHKKDDSLVTKSITFQFKINTYTLILDRTGVSFILPSKINNYMSECVINNGVNSAWYLMLEAMDEASEGKGQRVVGDSKSKDKEKS